MDDDLLKEKGFHPSNGKIAFAKGYDLRIGEKAALVQSASESSYGIVMSLSEEEIDKLYSAPGVSEYVPEHIEVTEQNSAILIRYCATTFHYQNCQEATKSTLNHFLKLQRKWGCPKPISIKYFPGQNSYP